MSSGIPVLLQDHKILGSEYCSGYTDIFGKWNTGFYCPQSESKTAVSCCGISTYKYCCILKESDEGLVGSTTEGSEVSLAPYLIRTPIILAAVAGVILVVLVLILVTSCYFCSCCPCSKKRRAQIPPGLYRLPLASSSTTSALMNVYALSSPMDMEWNQIQQGFAAANGNGPHPHPAPVLHNQLNNLAQPHSNPHPPNPPIRQHMPNGVNNRNGTIFAAQNGWLTNQYNSYNQQQQYPNQNIPPVTNNSHATLPRYFHYHQGNNLNRNINNHNQEQPGPPTRYSNNSLGRPNRPPRIDSNPPPTTYYGFTLGNESRPYLISNGQLDSRPRSMISFRNNVAYITSTLPLTNSFRSESGGGGGRRNVRFGGATTMNSSNNNNMSCGEARACNGTTVNPIKTSNVGTTGFMRNGSESPLGHTVDVIPEEAGPSDPTLPDPPPVLPPGHDTTTTESDNKEFKDPNEHFATRSVSDTELTTSFGSSPVKARVALLEEQKPVVAITTPPSNSLVFSQDVADADVDNSVTSGTLSQSLPCPPDVSDVGARRILV